MSKGFFLMTAVALSLVVAQCTSDNGNLPEPGAITLARTIPGGCNTMKSGEIISARGEERDTVIFSLRKDTLVMFTGISYICCAPFKTETFFRNDSLIVTLEDRCNYPQEVCYCKCMCYYTWEFLFTGFRQGTLKGYQVILDDPREKEQVGIMEGSVKL